MSKTKPRVLVGSYTHEIKSYCDIRFIERLARLKYEYPNSNVLLVDNTPGTTYTEHLNHLIDKVKQRANGRMLVHHYNPVMMPNDSPTHKNIAVSANILRDYFLVGGYDYLLILESDVIPCEGFVQKLVDRIGDLAIIEGIYYKGFHPDEWFRADHDELIINHMTVLSGCTLYSRKLLEQVKFRYDLVANSGAYPDAWISIDARNLGYNYGTYTGVKCQHLHDEKIVRGWGLLDNYYKK